MLDYINFPFVPDKERVLAVIDFERFPHKSDVDAWTCEIFNNCSDVAEEVSQNNYEKHTVFFLEDIVAQIREQIASNTGFLTTDRAALLENLDKEIDVLKYPKQSALSRLLSSF